MQNKGPIIVGVIVFLVLAAFPIWYNMATDRTDYVPVLEKAVRGDDCVRDADWMTAHHMDLLNDWRDQVVRSGERYEINADGVEYERSLSNTCLGCHENKDQFCDKCHDYMGVTPYCWDCHLVTKELSR